MSSQSNLPFLPGYRVDVNPRENFHKAHLFDVSNGIRVDLAKQREVAPSVNGMSSTAHPLQITSAPRDYKAAMDAKFATPEATMSRLPAWVAYDRKVLRFFGYFKESVFASNVENWRVRKCIVYFYLEDDSMHIAEPKIENSGIPQGVFVKRHRIPKGNSGNSDFFTINDLSIGAELHIYGRVFRLVDADEFTRAFYSQNGVDLGVSESYPLDPFTKKQTTSFTHTHNKLMNPLKEFMEASLGKHIHGGIENNQKFLKNDGKVLRFYAQWNDSTLYGEKKPYVIHFFLADNTVEVQEVGVPNSGRDPFPSLLKRQKLPKNFHEVGMDLSRIGCADDGKVQYYDVEDFRVGSYVQVYGRNLFICGADKFTQDFYIEHYGMTPDDFPRLNMDEPAEPVTKIAPPPHNGFGSDEDSLASFLYLMPKVPKQDFKKLIELDGINLRFLAKFINPAKVDKDRRFIVTYYLANDTIQVFEKFERNSGFIGGKFLERSRLKNPSTGEFFKPSDFFVGARVELNKNNVEVIDMDEYTLKFMKNNVHVWGAEKVYATSATQERNSFSGETTQQRNNTNATNDTQVAAF